MKTASFLAEGRLAHAGTRRGLRYGIKLALAVAVIAWLARGDGWLKIGQALHEVQASWFGLALLVYLVGQSLCAWKWSILAGSVGFRKPLRFYWVNYLGAMFPSLFLPTSVGGDVFRTLALVRGGGDKVEATVSVLADRGTGLLAMVWIAALASLTEPTVQHHALAARSIFVICAVLTAGFVLPFAVRPAFARRGFLGKVLRCWDEPAQLLQALLLSFIFQLAVCLIYILLGKALALPVDPRFYFLLCPIVSVAAMSPVTINGLGERVAALVYLFGLVRIGAIQATVFGLAWTALVTLASLFGGLVLFSADRQAGWNDAEDSGNGARQ